MLQQFEPQPLQYSLEIFVNRELKYKKQIQKLSFRLRAKDAENHELKEDNHRLKRENSDLGQENHELKEDNQELKDDSDEKNRKIQRLEDEIEIYQSEADPYSFDGAARCNRYQYDDY
ncbi:hypothetical protein [Dolichospermum circinale]|uniref:hypothetical protein n=1 Tax=Dolichospermum circinale TaxID=109265 RepID=UPI00232B41A6|nr:hypothetical protein [Dolichospermum circinale]MDB9450529.1 hypothetical protein [Dolichospermum circinale CS-547]